MPRNHTSLSLKNSTKEGLEVLANITNLSAPRIVDLFTEVMLSEKHKIQSIMDCEGHFYIESYLKAAISDRNVSATRNDASRKSFELMKAENEKPVPLNPSTIQANGIIVEMIHEFVDRDVRELCDSIKEFSNDYPDDGVKQTLYIKADNLYIIEEMVAENDYYISPMGVIKNAGN